MKDYIEREAAIRALCDGCVDDGYCGEKDLAGRYACDDVPKLLAIPAADVRPVVRGEWICLYDGNYKCSECGEWYSVDVTPIEAGMFYCPNCGADMRGEN